jgi:hypothetical protein
VKETGAMIKTMQRITRERALEILFREIPTLPNDSLGGLLDYLSDDHASNVSLFDNFIVSEFDEAPSILRGER